MSKTYTTGQIIDLLKPGQKAKCVYHPIACYTGLEVEYAHLPELANDYLVWSRNKEKIQISKYIAKCKWQLLPQYVTFEEAFKEWRKGKLIQCEINGRINRYGNNPFQAIQCVEIDQGKWSIVEEDSE